MTLGKQVLTLDKLRRESIQVATLLREATHPLCDFTFECQVLVVFGGHHGDRIAIARLKLDVEALAEPQNTTNALKRQFQSRSVEKVSPKTRRSGIGEKSRVRKVSGRVVNELRSFADTIVVGGN